MQPLLNQSCCVLDRVFQRALPDSGHTPAKSPECLHVSPVAINIAQEFLLPELLVGSRGSGIAAAFVPMPEASVDEYHRPVLWEHKVRRAGQLSDMKSIAKSPGEKKRSKGSLRPSILSANARHHAAALRGGRDAHDLGDIQPGYFQQPSLHTAVSQSDRGDADAERLAEVDSREITRGHPDGKGT